VRKWTFLLRILRPFGYRPPRKTVQLEAEYPEDRLTHLLRLVQDEQAHPVRPLYLRLVSPGRTPESTVQEASDAGSA
jgi:hypothetical protein